MRRDAHQGQVNPCGSGLGPCISLSHAFIDCCLDFAASIYLYIFGLFIFVFFTSYL